MSRQSVMIGNVIDFTDGRRHQLLRRHAVTTPRMWFFAGSSTTAPSLQVSCGARVLADAPKLDVDGDEIAVLR